MSALRVLLADDRLGYDDIGLHGGGRCMIQWTRALLARGVEVTPVIRQSSPKLRAAVEAEQLPFVYLDRHELDPRTLWDLVSIIRRRRIQVAHMQGLSTSQFGRIAARLTGIPAIVHVHGDYRLSKKGYPPHVRLADHALARSTARALLVSEAMRSFATEAMGFAPEQLTILHNPVDRSRFRRPSPEQRAAARRALDLPLQARVVVTVGRIDRLKGIDLQIAGWPGVVAQVPDAVLVVVGDGPLRAELEQQVAAHPWAASVRFLGYRSDVEAILWAGDVFAITSRSEGLGLVVLEAMSTGLPVVGAAVGGIPEIVTDGESGVVVPPEDSTAIANAVAKLLRDKELRERLQLGATRQADASDLARYTETLEATYRELIARRRAPS